MGTRLVTGLIDEALIMAIHRNKPSQGVIHHSDRGSQYCSKAYQALLKKHGFICSMSGAGNCYDNAVMESFYHTLKVEAVYGSSYKTRKEAQLALFDYIEVFYNRKRIHSTLGFQTPSEYGCIILCPVFRGRISILLVLFDFSILGLIYTNNNGMVLFLAGTIILSAGNFFLTYSYLSQTTNLICLWRAFMVFRTIIYNVFCFNH